MNMTNPKATNPELDTKPMFRINDEQYQFIIDNSYPTGSRIIGGSYENSDYDYVMLEETYLSNFCFPYGKYDDLFGTSSIKVLYQDMVVNMLITLSEFEYNAWVFATVEYQRLTNSKIVDKNIRVKLFSSLREVYLTLNG